MPKPRMNIQTASPPPNLVQVTIQGIRALALVDSGCPKNLISREFAARLSGKTRPSSLRMTAANSTKLQIKDVVQCKIFVGGFGHECEFHTCEELAFQIILGVDYLLETNAVIDFSRRMLSLHKDMVEVPLIRKTQGNQVFTVNAVTIPPWSQCLLPVRADKTLKDGTYTIDRHHKLPCDSLLVGRSASVAENGYTTCFVINPTNAPLKFRRHTPIGVASAVQPIECGDLEPPPVPEATVEQMQQFLKEKGFSFTETSVTGADLQALIKLLYQHQDLIASSLKDLTPSKLPPFKVETLDAQPIRARPFRYSLQQQEQINQQVKELLAANIITETDSPWSNAIILVKKPHDPKAVRLCLDLRALNSKTRLIATPLPLFEDIIDRVSQSAVTLWTKIDLRSAYHQISLDEGTRDRVSFQANGSTYTYLRMAFGLSNAPGHFHRSMSALCRNLPFAIVFLDDVLVLGTSPSDMLDKISKLFNRFRFANLHLHPQKCCFSCTKIEFLGHVFEGSQYAPNPEKTAVLDKYEAPRNAKQLKSFLAAAGFYRRFIQGFAQKTYNLRALLKKDTRFIWNDKCEEEFQAIKKALTNKPILQLPCMAKQFYLLVDSSGTGLSYTLAQKDEQNRLHACFYGGRSLSDCEKKWTITEQECLAVIEATKKLYPYLGANEFIVFSDHLALTTIQSWRLAPQGRLVRWALYLQQFSFKIVHTPGSLNNFADFLSRIEKYPEATKSDKLDDMSTDLLAESTETPQSAVGKCKCIDNVTMNEVSDNYLCAQVNDERASQERAYTRIDFHYQHEQISTAAVSTEAAAAVTSYKLPSVQQIKDALPLCPQLKHMYFYLRDAELPTEDQMARKVLLDSSNFTIENGLLYHLYVPRTKHLNRIHAIRKQLCIPSALQGKLITCLHDDNAHPGAEKVYLLARETYFFPGMYAFIKNHCKTCLVCMQSKREVHPHTVPTLQLESGPPGYVWNMDIHGKYVESNGFKYVLTLICHASLWPELIPLVSLDARSICSALYEVIICRWGCPAGLTLRSDLGSNFIAAFTKEFCKTFSVTQVNSTPFHHQPMVRAEAFGDLLHKSLRVLCEKQTDWSTHLPTICYAYRATPTLSCQLSPFEIIHATKMRLPIHLALSTGEIEATTPTELQAKLKILQTIALENSNANAKRIREHRNKDAIEPSFVCGQKVLLFNPATKKGESSKLTRRFQGPYFITECLSNYNYKLKHAVTGVELRRPVHASRLRCLYELANDYRLQQNLSSDVCMFVAHTKRRQLIVKVAVNDMAKTHADALAIACDESLNHVDSPSTAVIQAAGSDLLSICAQYVQQNGRLAINSVYETHAGNLQSRVHAIFHVVVPTVTQQNDVDRLYHAYYNTFSYADHRTDIMTLACPLWGTAEYKWAISQVVAKAIADFDEQTSTKPGCLRIIKILSLNLAVAETVVTVFRQMFPQASEIVNADNDLQPKLDQGISQPSTETQPASQWFEIERILKHRRRQGRDEFLVRWKNESPDQDSWVPRQDVTDFAIQQFYATRTTHRGRRKQN
jgi:O-acetyl-ADP-ribose deacetylase (regulator of RNase III)